MAIDRDVPTVNIVKERERTRSILCETPFNGVFRLTIAREFVQLDQDGKAVHMRGPIYIYETAENVARMVFTRADRTTFTGESLMADMALACDEIAQSRTPE
jgi:hypothetical protein